MPSPHRTERKRRRRRRTSPNTLVVIVVVNMMLMATLARRSAAWTTTRTAASQTRLLWTRRRIPQYPQFIGAPSSSFSVPTTTARSLASSSSSSDDSPRKKKQKKKKAFKVADKITNAHMDKLAAAFDEMARKEGFDGGDSSSSSSTTYYADDATFEDPFVYDDDGQMVKTPTTDVDDSAVIPSKKKNDNDDNNNNNIIEDTVLLDPMQLDEVIDFQDSKDSSSKDDDMDDMDARIAAAQRDMVTGQVSVPKELDDLAKKATTTNEAALDLGVLGFRREDATTADPFYDREARNQQQREFQLVTNAMVCSACGADFQCRHEQRPGFLPPEKFAIQVKLGKIEEMQRLQEKAQADDAEWTPEDEIDWLIQTSGASDNSNKKNQKQNGETATEERDDATTMDGPAALDIQAMAEEMGIDLEQLAGSEKKVIICKRCHGLQNFGKIDSSLRPGWTDEPTLSQEKFRELLRPIREQKAVIIALVDLFDFSGSVLPELDTIAGDDNPVILAANKADLLPSKMGHQRAENWVRRELEYMGIRSLVNAGGGAVRLISCKTGAGVGGMMTKARKLAQELDCDIYVVGAANAGKSTLLNHILGRSDNNAAGEEKQAGAAAGGNNSNKQKLRAGNRNKLKGAVTTSPLPGTTLKFIKVDLEGGRSLYDTPGLLVPGTLTQLLTPEELKIVVPKNQVEPITFRLSSGKAVLVGGLAKIELIGDCKPFFFSFFVANAIKLHPTDSSRADEFIRKHVGEMLVPPLPPGPERMKEFGEFETHVINVEGAGWKEAAADITLTGLGWVAVTGAGVATVQVSVPKGIGVSLRPPLMPYDIRETTARYTGSRAVRKSTKSKSGKRRKGVGRN